MKYFLPLIIILISSCGILQNGISYSGQDKLFSKNWQGSPTYIRVAYGREPGWELGFSFKINTAARLKGVWIKNPTLGNVPVTIWDVDSKTIVHSFQFNMSDTLNYNHFVLQQPIPLMLDKKYCLTINVAKYYYHLLPVTSFPIEINKVTFLNSVYEEAHYQRYPQNEVNNVVHGLLDVDIDFKQ